jgi:hypothetical protein
MTIEFSVNRNTLNKTLLTVLKTCHSLFIQQFIEKFQSQVPIEDSDYREATLIVDATINKIQTTNGVFKDKGYSTVGNTKHTA